MHCPAREPHINLVIAHIIRLRVSLIAIIIRLRLREGLVIAIIALIVSWHRTSPARTAISLLALRAQRCCDPPQRRACLNGSVPNRPRNVALRTVESTTLLRDKHLCSSPQLLDARMRQSTPHYSQGLLPLGSTRRMASHESHHRSTCRQHRCTIRIAHAERKWRKHSVKSREKGCH